MLILGIFYIGYYVGNNGNEIIQENSEDRKIILVYGNQSSANHSDIIEITEKLPIPSIDMEILDDIKSGWNIKLDIKNMEIVPEKASSDHIDQEGHIHLYIDDIKITRIYSNWHHIPALETGIHDIEVVLSANNHSEYTNDGNLISDIGYIISINI